MIIKKFQGKNEKDAMSIAEKELGKGIVIMNTKNVKRRGISRFFMPQLVEITVAKEEEPDRIQALKKEISREPTSDEVRESLQFAIREAAAEKQLKAVQKAETEEAFQSVLRSEEAKDSDNNLEEKLDSLRMLLEKQLENSSEDSVSKKEEAEPIEDTEQMRFVKILYHTMLENGVEEKYVNQIVDDLNKNIKPDVPMETLLENVYQKVVLKFGEPGGITPAEKGPKVIYFIGPTGVGKTTTIAKIASKFRLEQGKKIALFTADTYRIAATEQLRTYANILEVPFRIIYSAEELEEAMTEFVDYDYILVDTTGHSHRNAEQKEAMNTFIHCLDGKMESEVYLVLSATTKYSDLVSIADTYTAMTKYRLIFTKTDETTSLGSILNLKLYTGAELSYITCGQNVPSDIEEFNPQKTVKVLLGGK